jgi:hypothetical protein
MKLFDRLQRLNWLSRFEIVICSLVAYSVMSINIVEYDLGHTTVLDCLWKTIVITLLFLSGQRTILHAPKYIWQAVKWLIAEYRAFKDK